MSDETTEIKTAFGLSVRNLSGTQLTEPALMGWFTAFTAQIARHGASLQALLEIAYDIQQDRTDTARVPHPTNRFKHIFSRMGRALNDDSERITQDAVAGGSLKAQRHGVNHTSPRTSIG